MYTSLKINVCVDLCNHQHNHDTEPFHLPPQCPQEALFFKLCQTLECKQFCLAQPCTTTLRMLRAVRDERVNQYGNWGSQSLVGNCFRMSARPIPVTNSCFPPINTSRSSLAPFFTTLYQDYHI